MALVGAERERERERSNATQLDCELPRVFKSASVHSALLDSESRPTAARKKDIR